MAALRAPRERASGNSTRDESLFTASWRAASRLPLLNRFTITTTTSFLVASFSLKATIEAPGEKELWARDGISLTDGARVSKHD